VRAVKRAGALGDVLFLRTDFFMVGIVRDEMG